MIVKLRKGILEQQEEMMDNMDNVAAASGVVSVDLASPSDTFSVGGCSGGNAVSNVGKNAVSNVGGITPDGSCANDMDFSAAGGSTGNNVPTDAVDGVASNSLSSDDVDCSDDSASNSVYFPPVIKDYHTKKRIYNKHQACYYCSKLVTKISKHLLEVHKDKEEVKQVQAMRIGSSERAKAFERLRNRGNYYHNKMVRDLREGEMILVRRPSDTEIENSEYEPCPNCLGFYLKSDLWKHLRHFCIGKEDEKPTGTWMRSRDIGLESVLLMDEFTEASPPVKCVSAGMKQDSLSKVVQNDPVIMQLDNAHEEAGGSACNNMCAVGVNRVTSGSSCAHDMDYLAAGGGSNGNNVSTVAVDGVASNSLSSDDVDCSDDSASNSVYFPPVIKDYHTKKRIYNKHQACFYCSKLVTKISKHLLEVHKDKEEVKQIQALRVGSSERAKAFERLRNRGNYYHNKMVRDLRQGEMILVRRPFDTEIEDSEYEPCPSCLGFYLKSDLWKHLRHFCIGKEDEKLTGTQMRSRVIGLESALLMDEFTEASPPVKFVLAGMKQDSLSKVVQNDPVIMQLDNARAEAGGSGGDNVSAVDVNGVTSGSSCAIDMDYFGAGGGAGDVNEIDVDGVTSGSSHTEDIDFSAAGSYAGNNVSTVAVDGVASNRLASDDVDCSGDCVSNLVYFPPVLKDDHTKKRIYNKHQACYYCSKLVTFISKHLLRVHKDKEEVKQIQAMKAGSSERAKAFERLRNRGNYYHNKMVCDLKQGELILVRRPSDTGIKDSEYEPCPNCLGFYRKSDLWKHRHYSCIGKEDEKLTGTRRRSRDIGLRSALLMDEFTEASLPVKCVLAGMKQDSLSKVMHNDPVIMQLDNARAEAGGSGGDNVSAVDVNGVTSGTPRADEMDFSAADGSTSEVGVNGVYSGSLHIDDMDIPAAGSSAVDVNKVDNDGVNSGDSHTDDIDIPAACGSAGEVNKVEDDGVNSSGSRTDDMDFSAAGGSTGNNVSTVAVDGGVASNSLSSDVVDCSGICVSNSVYFPPVLKDYQTKKRIYNKHQACYYCSKLVTFISKHLLRVHKNEKEVKQIQAMKAGSSERAKAFERLRNRGNYYHNKMVRDLKQGELILVRRPSDTEIEDSEYEPCPNCLGFYRKTDIWKHRHYLKCIGKEDEKPTCTRMRSRDIGLESALLMDEFTEASPPVKCVSAGMKQDSLSKVVHNDPVIMQLDNSHAEACGSGGDNVSAVVVIGVNSGGSHTDDMDFSAAGGSTVNNVSTVAVDGGASNSLASDDVDCSGDCVSNSVYFPPVLKDYHTKKRIYNKHQACYYCSKLVTFISKHLLRVHKNEKEVKQIQAMKAGSSERAKAFERLRNRGNYYHNKMVRDLKQGELILVRRPSDTEIEDSEYEPCPNCLGFYRKTDIWKHRHYLKCIGKEDEKPTGTRMRSRDIGLESALLMDEFTEASPLVKCVSAGMKQDSLSKVVHNDPVIMQLDNSHAEACGSGGDNVSAVVVIGVNSGGSHTDDMDFSAAGGSTVNNVSTVAVDGGASNSLASDDVDCSGDCVSNSVYFPPVLKDYHTKKRIYNKHQACYYCSKLVTFISKHLLRVHKNEKEVKQIQAMKAGSSERARAFERLRNRGNYYHNKMVRELRQGELILVRRPSDTEIEDSEYEPCPNCLGFYRKSDLWKHQHYFCVGKEDEKPTGTQRRSRHVGLESSLLMDEFTEASPSVLAGVKQDSLSRGVHNESMIIELGIAHARQTFGMDPQKLCHYAAQEMRNVARQPLNRQSACISNCSASPRDFISPQMFDLVTARQVENDDMISETECPSVAFKFGHSLVKLATTKRHLALKRGDTEAEQTAEAFLKLKEAEWEEQISSELLKTMYMYHRKHDKVIELPDSEDVKMFASFLEENIKAATLDLKKQASAANFRRCSELVLARLTTFNKLRAGEMEHLSLQCYASRPNWNTSSISEIKKYLSTLERHIINELDMVYTRGKKGRRVPVLIPPEAKQAMDQLVSCRLVCGVTNDNQYFFARPGCSSYLQACDCLRQLAQEAELQKPHLLCTTRVRKYTATISQILILNESQLDWLADHLGQSLQVHRDFYELSSPTVELTKVAKLLLAIDTGDVGQFVGKSLDEIELEDLAVLETDDSDDDFDDEQQEPSGTASKVQTREPDASHQPHHSHTKPPLDLAVTDAGDSDDDIDDEQQVTGNSKKFRRVWTKSETRAVGEELRSFIKSEKIPGKSECEACIENQKAVLNQRSWRDVKYKVKTMIVQMKRR